MEAARLHARNRRRLPVLLVGMWFATKLQLAARLIEWLTPILKRPGKTV